MHNVVDQPDYTPLDSVDTRAYTTVLKEDIDRLIQFSVHDARLSSLSAYLQLNRVQPDFVKDALHYAFFSTIHTKEDLELVSNTNEFRWLFEFGAGEAVPCYELVYRQTIDGYFHYTSHPTGRILCGN